MCDCCGQKGQHLHHGHDHDHDHEHGHDHGHDHGHHHHDHPHEHCHGPVITVIEPMPIAGKKADA
ncbi:MAG: hypothetical protein ACOZHQ_08830 [Thermodesulfobacteriota bacterium]